MKKLIALVAICIVTKAQAQDSVVVAPVYYFDNAHYVSIEQMPYFAGGENEFEKVINNNIILPKSLKEKWQKFTVECLLSNEGEVLHVKAYTNETFLKPKDVYYIQNQIAHLLVNLPEKKFKQRRENGVSTYGVYKQEISVGGITQKPDPALQVKHKKEFYTKPAEVHFMQVAPSLGTDTQAELTKLINGNVRPLPLMQGHAFKFSASIFIDEDGNVKNFTYKYDLQLLKDNKSFQYIRSSPEYAAYDDWARKIHEYIATLKFKPGTVGGYATTMRLDVKLCVGTGCP